MALILVRKVRRGYLEDSSSFQWKIGGMEMPLDVIPCRFAFEAWMDVCTVFLARLLFSCPYQDIVSVIAFASLHCPFKVLSLPCLTIV